MQRPEADALLIAKHVKEWPYSKEKDGCDGDEALWLYWSDSSDSSQAKLTSMGLSLPAGIGRLSDNDDKGVAVFDAEDTVRCRMVFQQDEQDQSHVRHLLGRDISYDEWEEALEWLTEQEREHETAKA